MWIYEKKLEYPVKITTPNPALAKLIVSQLGGPDGELGAATRYLQQRYSMPQAQVKGMLTDIGTEELAHIEMVSAILYQLTRNLTTAQIMEQGFAPYFIDHTTGVYPQAASGVPFSASTLQVTGDAIADLFEDLAAEQKARVTYDNILRLADCAEVRDPIRFLREREIVHFQRFGESLRIVQDSLQEKNFYAFNPSFDKACNPPDVIATPAPICIPTPAQDDCCQKPACGCQMPKSSCGCEMPTPPCGGSDTPTPACGCCEMAKPPCGCCDMPKPPSGCEHQPVPLPSSAMPDCGCAHQVMPMLKTSCGCDTPKSSCGCAHQPMPIPETPCGCDTPKPSCGCQPPANPCYAKHNKRTCGCG